MAKHSVMLTFDLEEFDIPEEFGQKVSHQEQIEVTAKGTERLLQVLGHYGIKATFFTTGYYAEQNPELVKRIATKHEIASHALFHNPFRPLEEDDIAESKTILERISGQKVVGFRMPRLQPFPLRLLTDADFEYDSSINPTYLPGRYNLLHKNPLPYREEGIIELPCSTTPFLRFPLFWLAFKNLPISLYARMCNYTLKKRENLMLYFHPWEFADISGYKLPIYIKKNNGEQLAEKLNVLIDFLIKREANFITCREFCKIRFE
jgi:peptidoglycan/xylan/chitin deacetylase (PgdA/CDA1 family)